MAVEAASTVATNPIYADVTFYLSIAAALLSFATFVVGYSQMKIASAKVKLDLYNKRFSVYLAALEYYQAVRHETDISVFNRIKLDYIKCYRESKFLFAEKDGIYKTLTSIKDCGGPIGAYRKAKAVDESKGSSTADALHDKYINSVDKLKDDLLKLEDQLNNYIDFRVVDGWSLWSKKSKSM